MKGMAVSLLRARRPIFESRADAAERLGETGWETRGPSIKTLTSDTPVNTPARGSGLQTHGISGRGAEGIKPNEGPRVLHFTEDEVQDLQQYMEEPGQIVLEVTGRFERGKEAKSVLFNVDHVEYANGNGGDNPGVSEGYPSAQSGSMSHARTY